MSDIWEDPQELVRLCANAFYEMAENYDQSEDFANILNRLIYNKAGLRVTMSDYYLAFEILVNRMESVIEEEVERLQDIEDNKSEADKKHDFNEGWGLDE